MSTNASASELRRFFIDRVRLVGGLPLALTGSLPGQPDVVVLIPGGGVFFVELRSPCLTTESEEFWRSKLRAMGVYVHRLESKKEVVGWIRAAVDYTEAQDNASMIRRIRQPAQT